MTCRWCDSLADGKMLMGYANATVCVAHFIYCTSISNHVLTYDDRPGSKNKKIKLAVFEPRVLLPLGDGEETK